MTDRQFFWGLSNGVTALTGGGFFWFGLAMSAVPWTQPFFLVLVATSAVLLVGAVRVRRKARGFRFSELDRRHPQTRRMLLGLRWSVLAQGLLVALAVFLCFRVDRRDLIWPAIGLVVGLHLLPLGRVFHVPVYYATGLATAMVSLAALTGALGSPFLAVFAAGLGVTMWATVIYLLLNADRVVASGIGTAPSG